MKFSGSTIILFLTGIVLLNISCRSTRRLKEGEFLLVKNTVINKNAKIDNGELSSYIKQKPNRKIFGVWRFHLMLHNWGSGKNDSSKFNRWLQRVGEASVVLDSFQTKRSLGQLNTYLKSKGYFEGKVKDSVTIKRKKARVLYTVESGKPYIIRNYSFVANDSILLYIARSAERINRLVIKGNPYDADVLDAEREKITREMKMKGFYYFEKDYIRFEADTTIGNREVDIKCVINNPLIASDTKPDSLVEGHHQIYRLGRIYINTQFNPKSLDFGSPDTLVYNNVTFTYDRKMKFRPGTLMDALAFRSHTGYQINQVENTYRRISDLKTFRFSNINFSPNTTFVDNKNILDAYIYLTPSPKQYFDFSTQGTNTSGNLGVSANVVYQNRNAFRGAEMLELKLLGGLENQFGITGPDRKIGSSPFNTLEIGSEVNLYFPKFILPFGLSKLSSKVSAPRTNLKFLVNLQQRPDFTRNNARVSYGINFKKGNFHRFFLNIYEVNRVNVYNLSETFSHRLDTLADPAVKYSYQPHFTVSTNFTYQFTNQQVSKLQDFSFFRFYIESAGSTMMAISRTFKGTKDTLGNYLLLGVPFAHFLKLEGDFRHYFVFNARSQFVVRLNAGVGIPLGNLGTLPYENNYFAGGANGIRAWNYRRLGPGSEPNDQIAFGDMKMEANAEYRFGVYKFFKMALFADAGNVWFTSFNKIKSKKGEFNIGTFPKQIAVGAGIGIRLDFNFFVIRLDAALKLHNPVKEDGERWFTDLTYQKEENSPKRFNLFKVPTYQIGIGYPF